MINIEIDGELIGNDLRIETHSEHPITFEDAKIRHLEQSEYDKFIELYPEYRVKIENYQNWFKLQNNERI